ncbi:hypothetical protein HDE_00172 [Halotydeus destructor]|nr:hypothetical protein HDE_00172 [Halotydeus destructor]
MELFHVTLLSLCLVCASQTTSSSPSGSGSGSGPKDTDVVVIEQEQQQQQGDTAHQQQEQQQQQAATVVKLPDRPAQRAPTAPSPGHDFSGAFSRALYDALGQFRILSEILAQMAQQVNQMVATGSRLVIGLEGSK